MKTTYKTLLIVWASLLTTPLFSQSGYLRATHMDVKGIFIGGTYAKTQLESKWGVATKYKSSMSEFGLDEMYYYNDTWFKFSDNGIFIEFVIRSSHFPVLTTYSGGIKVGDNISRIQAIGLNAPVLQKDGIYHLFLKILMTPFLYIT